MALTASFGSAARGHVRALAREHLLEQRQAARRARTSPTGNRAAWMRLEPAPHVSFAPRVVGRDAKGSANARKLT